MSQVRYELDDEVALVTLDNPERRNALDASMSAELCAALERAEGDRDARALIVTGAGAAFCAGADRDFLAAQRRRPEAERAVALQGAYRPFLILARSSLPTVAAVNGPAVGAGLNLALAADVRVVSPAARFIPGFARIGLHPGGGNTWMLDRLVGQQRTAAMHLFGLEVRGDAAVGAGLALECVAPESLLGRARELARAASGSRALVARLKETLRRTREVSFEEALRIETEAQAWSVAETSVLEPSQGSS